MAVPLKAVVGRLDEAWVALKARDDLADVPVEFWCAPQYAAECVELTLNASVVEIGAALENMTLMESVELE